MSIFETLQWVQGTELGIALRKSNHLVGASFQFAHVLGIVLLLASVTLMSLRLLGLAFVKQAPARIVETGNKVLGLSLAVVVISGTLIFLSGPVRYYSNEFFRIKIVVLVAALLFQASLFRVVSQRAARYPLAAKAVAIVSLLLWFGVGASARMIGFI